MKSLNIKIPLSIAQQLDDNAQLNPEYLTGFLVSHLSYGSTIKNHKLEGLMYNYTFKAPKDLHRMVKLKAIELDLPMNEFAGRLLAYYYKG